MFCCILAPNVPGAAAVADLEPLNCLRNENFFSIQMYQFKMKTAIEAAPCYAFVLMSPLRFTPTTSRYSTIEISAIVGGMMTKA